MPELSKITSSVAAAALGHNPYMSPYGAKQTILGHLNDGNAVTDRGVRLEPVILQWGADQLALTATPAPRRQHPRHTWASDAVDCLYTDTEGRVRHLGEGKSVNSYMATQWGSPDASPDEAIPMATWIQCHWHLIHWPETDSCMVPWLGGSALEFRMYEVTRDNEVADHILGSCYEWYQRHIVHDETPTPDHRDEGLLRLRCPHSAGPMIETDAQTEQLIGDLREVREIRSQAETTEADIKAQLIERIGEGEGLHGDWGKITYRQGKDRQVVDWKAAAIEAGATESMIAAKTTERAGSRSFRIAWRDA